MKAAPKGKWGVRCESHEVHSEYVPPDDYRTVRVIRHFYVSEKGTPSYGRSGALRTTKDVALSVADLAIQAGFPDPQVVQVY